jgi:hypothetical protein
MRGLLLIVRAAVAALLLSGSAAAATPATVIRDPHYGDALFHFYQDRYFTALTGLMASQHFGRVARHADEAEILRGGMLLSYGLHQQAAQIFAGLLEGNAAPAVADRAWFYLAKIRYQRGLLAEAEQAIGRVGDRLPPALDEERVLLHAQLLMARADYAGAAQLLAAAKTANTRYARYNLGVALVRSGDPARGAALLDELGRAPAADEEARALRDRANVALGFTALQQGAAQQARAYLERVRLDSLHANKALLGFGWAAAELGQPKLALVPWQELVGRDPGDAAVLEARLAVPHAYGELGAHRQSLQLYEQAIDAFAEEGDRLDASVAAIRAGRLIEGLLAVDAGEEMGWLHRIDRLPEMPHAAHLASLAAEHAFQEGFKNYRDLLFLERNLRRWKDSLEALRDMVAHRRQAFAQRLPQVRDQRAAAEVAGVAARGAQLAGEVARIAADGDVAALADAREMALAQRLARVREGIERLGDDAQAAQLRERARRVAGALAWQQAEQYPQRLWQARKVLREIDALLPQLQGGVEALARSQVAEPANFDGFAERIDALQRQIDAALPRATELARLQQAYVQELAAGALLKQKERLAEYVSQARFAVARLYDRAHLAADSRHDARP